MGVLLIPYTRKEKILRERQVIVRAWKTKQMPASAYEYAHPECRVCAENISESLCMAVVAAMQDRVGRWFFVEESETNEALRSISPLDVNPDQTCDFCQEPLGIAPSNQPPTVPQQKGVSDAE